MPTSQSRIPSPLSRHTPSTSPPIARSKIPKSPSSGRSSAACTQTSPGPLTYKISSSPSTTPSPVIKPAPRQAKETKRMEQKPEPVRSSSNPRYIGSHLGEPCTVGSLDHLLTCGHKILTDSPENCASNCNQMHPQFANPRGLDEPFVCMTCIIQQIKDRHCEKAKSFQEELNQVYKVAGKVIPRAGFESRMAIIQIGWREMERIQINAAMEVGRFSRPFYVDPAYQDIAAEVLEERHLANRSAVGMTALKKALQLAGNHSGSPDTSSSSSSRRLSSSPSSTSHSTPSKGTMKSKLPVSSG